MDDRLRGETLRHFLIERRARLKPRDVGFVPFGVRRCPGLRREEVAELAGVSARWYALLEADAGRRRFSLRTIERVADALRLDGEDRLMLMRLAVPEVARAADQRDDGSPLAKTLVQVLRDLATAFAVPIAYEEAVRITESRTRHLPKHAEGADHQAMTAFHDAVRSMLAGVALRERVVVAA